MQLFFCTAEVQSHAYMNKYYYYCSESPITDSFIFPVEQH